ncbi:hypothetical protein ABZ914_03220 [Spirillospora sp. NPDC046719]
MIWLRMSTAEPGTCRINAPTAAVDSGLVTPATRINPAVAEGDSEPLPVARLRPLAAPPQPRGYPAAPACCGRIRVGGCVNHAT